MKAEERRAESRRAGERGRGAGREWRRSGDGRKAKEKA